MIGVNVQYDDENIIRKYIIGNFIYISGGNKVRVNEY